MLQLCLGFGFYVKTLRGAGWGVLVQMFGRMVTCGFEKKKPKRRLRLDPVLSCFTSCLLHFLILFFFSLT